MSIMGPGMNMNMNMNMNMMAMDRSKGMSSRIMTMSSKSMAMSSKSMSSKSMSSKSKNMASKAMIGMSSKFMVGVSNKSMMKMRMKMMGTANPSLTVFPTGASNSPSVATDNTTESPGTVSPTTSGTTPVPTTPGTTPNPTELGTTPGPTTTRTSPAPTVVTPEATTAPTPAITTGTLAPTTSTATTVPTIQTATIARSFGAGLPETIKLKDYEAAADDESTLSLPVATRFLFRFFAKTGREPTTEEISALVDTLVSFFQQEFQNNPTFKPMFKEFQLTEITPKYSATDNPDKFILESMALVKVNAGNSNAQHVSGSTASQVMGASHFDAYIGNYLREMGSWSEFYQTHTVSFTGVSHGV
ncbi:expressed unknown protein [Seminavis robusta]|uniref:Uncharacterized protein n=1 Tax=Seminavis robusta TaxID=568900 RepID=A0A9N8DSJ5_9STRA|nr:expressed unknown protein [Seminavis robusta]|eukprot:Sro340_g121230.1 n/a (360) ;mRNA; r:31532-32611